MEMPALAAGPWPRIRGGCGQTGQWTLSKRSDVFIHDFSLGEKGNHILTVYGQIIKLHTDGISTAPDNLACQINMFVGKWIKER